MRAVPEAPASSRQERIAGDVPGDVALRLRMWAALRGQPVAHVVAEVICRAVPTAAQLAVQMQDGVRGDQDDR
jgi:hypothetical protein